MAARKKRGTAQRSPAKSSSAPPPPQSVGVETFDTEERIVLVLGDVERTAGALARHTKAKTWLRDAYGQTVAVSEPSYMVLRLKGQPWSMVVGCTSGPRGLLGPADAKALAKSLKTKAIYFANSDCASATEYELFDAGGKSRERFRCVEEVELTSDARDVEAPEDGPEIYEFVRQFMREQGAHVPPLSIEFLAGDMSAGQKVELVAQDDLPDEAVERLDFVGVAGPGGKGNGKARGTAAATAAAAAAPARPRMSAEDRREAVYKLFSAVDGWQVDDVRRLLDAGVDPNVKEPGGGPYALTALCEAVAVAGPGRLASAAKLRAALHGKVDRAKMRADALEVVRLLLAAGADANGATATRTPLSLAAEGGDADTARLLLDAGADPAGPCWSPASKLPRTKGGGVPFYCNALHAAAEKGAADVVELLLARGADTSAKDHEGKTAVDIAADRKHARVLKVLRRPQPAGAKRKISLAKSRQTS